MLLLNFILIKMGNIKSILIFRKMAFWLNKANYTVKIGALFWFILVDKNKIWMILISGNGTRTELLRNGDTKTHQRNLNNITVQHFVKLIGMSIYCAPVFLSFTPAFSGTNLVVVCLYSSIYCQFFRENRRLYYGYKF